MKFKKMVMAGVLAGSFLFQSAAFAGETKTINTAKPETVQEASAYLGEVMDYISKNYVGDEVSINALYEAAAHGMLTPLDTFSEYLTHNEYANLYDNVAGNFKGIGIQFMNSVDGSLIVKKVFDGPAKVAGIKVGDVLLSVNGTEVTGYATVTVSQIVAQAEGKIKVVIKRGDENITMEVEKSEIKMTTVESGLLGEFLPEAKNKKLGYIAISQIGERTATETADAVSKLKASGITGIVIDLRGNPGGLKNVIEDISRMFVPKGVIFSTIDKSGKTKVYNSELTTVPFKNVTILVDHNSASAAELFTSAMQDAKAATVIGQTTFGKGIIQSFASLENGDTMKLTTMEYLRRSGEKINKIGVIPDIVISHPKAIDQTLLEINNDNTGVAVGNLKQVLKYIGYKAGSDDNIYDDVTKESVKQIQKLAKLNQSGNIDVQTIQAIRAAYSEYLTKNDLELKKAFEVLTQVQ